MVVMAEKGDGEGESDRLEKRSRTMTMRGK